MDRKAVPFLSIVSISISLVKEGLGMMYEVLILVPLE
jgi:hypothetical protein